MFLVRSPLYPRSLRPLYSSSSPRLWTCTSVTRVQRLRNLIPVVTLVKRCATLSIYNMFISFPSLSISPRFLSFAVSFRVCFFSFFFSLLFYTRVVRFVSTRWYISRGYRKRVFRETGTEGRGYYFTQGACFISVRWSISQRIEDVKSMFSKEIVPYGVKFIHNFSITPRETFHSVEYTPRAHVKRKFSSIYDFRKVNPSARFHRN